MDQPDAQCHPVGVTLVLRDDLDDETVCVQPPGREVLTGLRGGELYVPTGTVALSLGPSRVMKLFSSRGPGPRDLSDSHMWVQAVLLQDGHVGWVYDGTYVPT